MSSINNNPNAGAAPVPGQSQGAPNQVGNETGTGNAGAAPASGPAGGTLPADVGAALADAGVMAPTVETPDSLPTQKKESADLKPRVEHHAKDEVDTTERPKDSRGTERKAEPNADDRGMVRNPFGELRRGAVEARAHELASALDVDTEIDVPLNAQGKLLGFGKKLMGKGAERAPQVMDRLADGMLLVGDDAQGVTLKQAAKKAAQSESRRFLNKTEHTRHMKRLANIMQQMKLSRIGSDPQSFVMRVMREAYAIGNEQMKDYADRLKKTNELREGIRKEAQRTRDALLETSGMEEDDLLDVPFDKMDVDTTARQITEAFVSAEEVAAEETRLASEVQEMSEYADDPKAFWDQQSEISQHEIDWLKRISNEENEIEDNLSRVTDLFSKMSIEEFKKYGLPVLDELHDGRTNENDLLELYKPMDPYQFMIAVEAGYASDFDGKERDQRDILFDEKLQAMSDRVDVDLYGQVTGSGPRAEARSALALADSAVSAAASRDPSDHPEAENIPQVGDRDQARTVGDLRNYEKYLEDQLNSAGEDGQLMNLELQNQLQRQQQQLQMMSNMSKAMHDVAMGILRNVGS